MRKKPLIAVPGDFGNGMERLEASIKLDQCATLPHTGAAITTEAGGVVFTGLKPSTRYQLVEEMSEPTGANTHQVGGEHYRKRNPQFQHWDWAAVEQLDYFQGCITKYVARWRDKKGLEDLEKAKHYLDKYIELIKAGVIGKEPVR